MSYLRINGRTIKYDEKLPYLSMGVVGSGHGGEVYDIFSFDPRSRFGHQSARRRRFSKDMLEAELEGDLASIRQFLEKGVFNFHTRTKELTDGERPAFKNTERLYSEILSALKGK